MSKKYLSIEEAAEQIGIPTSELNRLREKGTIRAFADRGTWKFKEEDVEKLSRSRQADSDPDVPLQQPDDGSSADLLFTDEDVLGSQPTIISKPGHDDSGSDSDVRLIFDDAMTISEPKGGPPQDDSDSDVKLAGAQAGPQADDSDSDVKLAGMDSGRPLDGSDSDVKLVTDELPLVDTSRSDSDVRLVSSDSSGEVKLSGTGSSDSIPVISEDGGSTIDVSPLGSSVIDDESGISLGEGSGIALASDSGISLERPNDSGISLSDDSSLVLHDDSGISLAADKPSSGIKSGSGISLDKPPSSIKSSSGISLNKPPSSVKKKKGSAKSPADSDDLSGTVPLMDVPLGQEDDLLDTQMEVPSLGDSGESADLFGDSQDGSTNVITLDDDEGYDVTSEIPRGSAALDEEEEAVIDDDEPVDVADDLVGEDDELSEDVFGAEDEDFAGDDVESGESQSELPIAPRGIVAATEQEWGAGTHAALIISAALMVACGTVLFDLVRNIWQTSAANHNPVASALLDMLRGA